MKKGRGTARSKERNIWLDDLCFLQFIDNLANDWMNSLWMIIFETYLKNFSRNQFIKVFGANTIKYGVG